MRGKFVNKAVDGKRGWAGCLESCVGGKWGVQPRLIINVVGG